MSSSTEESEGLPAIVTPRSIQKPRGSEVDTTAVTEKENICAEILPPIGKTATVVQNETIEGTNTTTKELSDCFKIYNYPRNQKRERARELYEKFLSGNGLGSFTIVSLCLLDLKMKQKIDPYIKISFGSGGSKFKTDIQYNVSDSCSWNNLDFSCITTKAELENGAMIIELWDRNYIYEDKMYGYAVVPLLQTLLDNKSESESIFKTVNIMQGENTSGTLLFSANIAGTDMEVSSICKMLPNDQSIKETAKLNTIYKQQSSGEAVQQEKEFGGGKMNIYVISLAQSWKRFKQSKMHLVLRRREDIIRSEELTEENPWWNIRYEFPTKKYVNLDTITIELYHNDYLLGIGLLQPNSFIADANEEIILTIKIQKNNIEVGNLQVVGALMTKGFVAAEIEQQEAEILNLAEYLLKMEEDEKKRKASSEEKFIAGMGKAFFRVISISGIDMRIKATFNLDILDPYVKVRLKEKNIEYSTKCQNNAGKDATWLEENMQVLCDYADFESGSVEFEVWDSNSLTSDWIVGSAKFTLNSLLDKINTDIVLKSPIFSNEDETGHLIIVTRLVPFVPDGEVSETYLSELSENFKLQN